MFSLQVPAWVLWTAAGYAVLSAAATAMDPKDKTFYGFLRRFLQALTFSARSELVQLHIPLPQVPPTQADTTTALSAAPTQNQ